MSADRNRPGSRPGGPVNNPDPSTNPSNERTPMTDNDTPPAREMSERMKEMLRKRDESQKMREKKLAELKELEARRRSNPVQASGRPIGGVPMTNEEIRNFVLSRKRLNMTQEEEEMYEFLTDPVTRIPPMDVRGTWDCATIDW